VPNWVLNTPHAPCISILEAIDREGLVDKGREITRTTACRRDQRTLAGPGHGGQESPEGPPRTRLYVDGRESTRLIRSGVRGSAQFVQAADSVEVD
jgi:hypothetical protein